WPRDWSSDVCSSDLLLDASQMQAGRLKLERNPADISALVSGAVDAERLATEARPWVVQIEPGLRASVDAVRFEQVVVNLLDNAKIGRASCRERVEFP